MSHLTNMKTRFQNLFYLEKTLNKLKIISKREKQIVRNKGLISYNTNLILFQPNGHDIKFSWNNQSYHLTFDTSFWKQPYSIPNFVAKISQEYAGQVIIGESEKEGFKVVNYKTNADGSNTITLGRWNPNM